MLSFFGKGAVQAYRKAFEISSKIVQKWSPGASRTPPESQIGVKFRKVASGAVPSEFFLKGRVSDAFRDAFFPFLS